MHEHSRRSFLGQLAGAAAVATLGNDRIAPAAPAVPMPRPMTNPGEDYWIELKRQFTFPDGQIPMNAANMCPGPRGVVEAVVQATRDVDADVSYQNRSKFDALRETTRERVARLLSVATDEIALVRNATEANNLVVGGLALKAGDEVVVVDQNHASNNVAWDVRAARFGFAVRRVSFPTPPASVAEVVSAMTRALTDRTRVLTFSDLSNTTGLRMPAAELCRIARQRGIYLHLDGAQTCGALQRDLRELGCDSYTASGQKWLLGPREIGILYVRSERIAELWPGVVGNGWGSTAATTAKGARKFEAMGQRNDAATAGLAAALDFHDQVGTVQIEARVRELAGRLHDGLLDAGFEMVTSRPAELRHGVIVVKADQAVAQRWHQRLYAGYGIISSPTGGLRLSPNICVTLADIDRVLAGMAAVRRET
jgi:selenocysteine lyase/cysteine desulfurase